MGGRTAVHSAPRTEPTVPSLPDLRDVRGGPPGPQEGPRGEAGGVRGQLPGGRQHPRWEVLVGGEGVRGRQGAARRPVLLPAVLAMRGRDHGHRLVQGGRVRGPGHNISMEICIALLLVVKGRL